MGAWRKSERLKRQRKVLKVFLEAVRYVYSLLEEPIDSCFSEQEHYSSELGTTGQD